MTERASNTANTTDEYGSGRTGQVSDDALLSFGRALGGDPSTVTDLPFTGPAETGASEERYVNHDEQVDSQMRACLADGDHLAVWSGPGTGKTTICSHLASELRNDEAYLVATVHDGDPITPRHLCERVLRTAHDAGCGIDPADYWQVDDGVPWQTDEIDRAVWEATANVRADGRQFVLFVDDADRLSPEASEQVRRFAKSGVQLALFGSQTAESVVEPISDGLSDELHTVGGIEPFDAVATKIYITQTLGAFTTTETPALFSDAIIESLTAKTGGNPREIRDICFDLFARAADIWQDSDVPAEQVEITPALVTDGRLRPA